MKNFGEIRTNLSELERDIYEINGQIDINKRLLAKEIVLLTEYEITFNKIEIKFEKGLANKLELNLAMDKLNKADEKVCNRENRISELQKQLNDLKELLV